MVNKSKLCQPRFWRKWYASGAVPQKQLPEGCRVVLGISVCYRNGCEAEATISVGKAIRSFGELTLDGSITTFVVPSGRMYRFGMPIQRIPGNAIPTRLFYGNEISEE